MKDYDLIQVLWVEDDPKVTETYPLEAEIEGLELVAFPCWDDAKEALEKDYDRWSAIILDAKCKQHRVSEDNAIRFLGQALADIRGLREQKGRLLPWYVLTGGAESEVSDSILDERLEWDEDWTKAYNKTFYSKNTDRQILYQRIRVHHNKSHRLQIQKMYKNVFDAITECGIHDDAYNALEDLLLPIHFTNDIEDKDYNEKYAEARTVIEYIFRSMSKQGMLPEWGKQVNTQWSSCLLSGMDAKKKDKDKYDIVVIESKKRVATPVVNRLLREIVNIVPAFCHSDNEEDGEIKKEEYLTSVENSTFLLKSITLQLCDIILWYRNYLRDNPDKEENMKNWEIKEPQYIRGAKIGSK